jgi:hypothetical protein
VPASKTLLGVFDLWRQRPAAFGFNQIAHGNIVRRSPSPYIGWLVHANIQPDRGVRR